LILNCIMGDKNDRHTLRLSILKGIYNCYSETNICGDIYLKVLQFALETNQDYLVIPELDNIEKIIQDWNLTNVRKRELYQIAVRMISSKDPQKAMKFIHGYLSSIDGDFINYANIIKENLLYLIKNDNIFCYGSLVDLPSIKSLETDPLYQLFQLLTSGEYSQLINYCNTANQYLQDEGIDVEKLKYKFRVIRLSEVASTKDILQYEEIANALSIDIDEVESWVIRAISKKLLVCKLDQLENRVLITKAIPRIYKRGNWEELERKVDSWKNNLQSLLQTLNTNNF